MRAVAVRERTEFELRSFLEQRRVEPEVVDDVVAAVVAEGLVDDASYARRFAEDRRLLDRWGSERIARDLARRGVARELVELALAGHGREEELGMALELLERRFPAPLAGDGQRDKAWRMLVRRGYGAELAYEAVRRHDSAARHAA